MTPNPPVLESRYVPIAMVLLVAVGLVGCAGRTVVPPGAQQIRLHGTPTAVTIQPSIVRAGDVYVVIEGTGAELLARSEAPEDFGGFTPEELAHITRTGDLFHTSQQGVTGGYAGNVLKLSLPPGRYAFLPIGNATGPEVDISARNELCHRDPAACDALPPLPVTVLEVTP